MTRCLWLLAFLLPAASIAQETKTTGQCSPVVSKSTSVTVNCGSKGLSAKDALALSKQYAAILNQIRDRNLDYSAVMQKLNSIGSDVSSIKTSLEARHFSPKQLAAFAQISETYPHPVKFTVRSLDPSADSRTLFDEVVTAFGIQNWPGNTLERLTDFFSEKLPPAGIFVIVNSTDFSQHSVPPLCWAMADTSNLGLKISVDVEKFLPPGQCVLAIGPKQAP